MNKANTGIASASSIGNRKKGIIAVTIDPMPEIMLISSKIRVGIPGGGIAPGFLRQAMLT
jgi:hypothetical protein